MWERNRRAMNHDVVFEILPVMVRMHSKRGELVHPNVLIQVPR
jgi:hypothetical protein